MAIYNIKTTTTSSWDITFIDRGVQQGRFDFSTGIFGDKYGSSTPSLNGIFMLFYASNSPVQSQRLTYQVSIQNTIDGYDDVASISINGRRYDLDKHSLDTIAQGVTYRQYDMTSDGATRVTNQNDQISATNLTNTFRFFKSDGNSLMVITEEQEQLNYKHILIQTKALSKIYKRTGESTGLVSGGVRSFTLDAHFDTYRFNNTGYYPSSDIRGSVSPADTNSVFITWFARRFFFGYLKSALSDKTPSKLIVNENPYDILRSTDSSDGVTPRVLYTTMSTDRHSAFESAPVNPITVDVEFTDGTLLYGGRKLEIIWENAIPPVITSFTASPNSFDLDSQTPANVSLSFRVEAYMRASVDTQRVTLDLLSNGIRSYKESGFLNNDFIGLSFPSVFPVKQVTFYFSGQSGSPAPSRNVYQFDILNIAPGYHDITMLDINGTEYNLSKEASDRIVGNISFRRYTTTTNVPAYTSSTSHVDLKYKTSDGTYIFGGGTTQAQVYLDPEGTKVGNSFSATTSIISQSFNVPRPTKNQKYRLLVLGDNGSAHQDVDVTVTQNPVITDLKRVGYGESSGIREGDFRFTATIKGYPQPEITYLFGEPVEPLVSGGVRSITLLRTNGIHNYHIRTQGSINPSDNNLKRIQAFNGGRFTLFYSTSVLSGKTVSKLIVNGVSYNATTAGGGTIDAVALTNISADTSLDNNDYASPVTVDVGFSDGTFLYSIGGDTGSISSNNLTPVSGQVNTWNS